MESILYLSPVLNTKCPDAFRRSKHADKDQLKSRMIFCNFVSNFYYRAFTEKLIEIAKSLLWCNF